MYSLQYLIKVSLYGNQLSYQLIRRCRQLHCILSPGGLNQSLPRFLRSGSNLEARYFATPVAGMLLHAIVAVADKNCCYFWPLRLSLHFSFAKNWVFTKTSQRLSTILCTLCTYKCIYWLFSQETTFVSLSSSQKCFVLSSRNDLQIYSAMQIVFALCCCHSFRNN